MSKNKSIPEQCEYVGFWKVVSGRRDKYGKFITTFNERIFSSPSAVDLAIDLAEPATLRNLANWIPQLEGEQAAWAAAKVRYIQRALLRPRDAHRRSLVRQAVTEALGLAPSPALRKLAFELDGTANQQPVPGLAPTSGQELEPRPLAVKFLLHYGPAPSLELAATK